MPGGDGDHAGFATGTSPAICVRLYVAMKIVIQLMDGQASLLKERAKRLGVMPEELARSVLYDALSEQNDRFAEVAESVLNDHAELYKRLA